MVLIRVPDVKNIEVTVPHLPPQMDGLRLVQLTDLHASRLLQAPWDAGGGRKTTPCNRIWISGSPATWWTVPAVRAADVQPLQQLSARYGVFAIPGNHEYYVDYVHWLPAFEQLGLHMLLNDHVLVTHNGRQLVLAGITDKAAATTRLPLPDVAAALRDARRMPRSSCSVTAPLAPWPMPGKASVCNCRGTPTAAKSWGRIYWRNGPIRGLSRDFTMCKACSFT